MDKCMNKCIDEGWIYAVLNFLNKYSKSIINKIVYNLLIYLMIIYF